jgi:hypothetical protein
MKQIFALVILIMAATFLSMAIPSDGMRTFPIGIAVLLVIIYDFVTRWSNEDGDDPWDFEIDMRNPPHILFYNFLSRWLVILTSPVLFYLTWEAPNWVLRAAWLVTNVIVILLHHKMACLAAAMLASKQRASSASCNSAYAGYADSDNDDPTDEGQEPDGE